MCLHIGSKSDHFHFLGVNRLLRAFFGLGMFLLRRSRSLFPSGRSHWRWFIIGANEIIVIFDDIGTIAASTVASLLPVRRLSILRFLLWFEIALGDVADEFEILAIFEVFGVMKPDVEAVVLQEVVRFKASDAGRDEG